MNEFLLEQLLRVRQQADSLIRSAAELFEEVESGDDHVGGPNRQDSRAN